MQISHRFPCSTVLLALYSFIKPHPLIIVQLVPSIKTTPQLNQSRSFPLSKMGFFKMPWKKTSETSNAEKELNKSDPPPYSNIKAFDAPQWLWSQAECQEWITAIHVTYLNYEPKKARAKAAKFEGFGPTLFGNTLSIWRSVLGSDADGHAIFSLIFSLRDELGAMPANTTFPHYERGN